MALDKVSRRIFVGQCTVSALAPAIILPPCATGLAARACEFSHDGTDEWLKPQGLKKGDQIALVAPSGPPDRSLVLSYKKQLEEAGFRVLMDERMPDRKLGYLAGIDSERVDELNRAIRDPNVRAIFPVRGGFGLTRILDQIDYATLRKDPKVVIGYSDLTALHLAIARKAKVVSFHSPMPMSNLVHENVPEHAYAKRLFERMLLCDQYPQSMKGTAIELPLGHAIKTIKSGKSLGRLLGGNLSLLCSTMGTPFAIEPAGAVLFMEDVNEAPYRVDRLLSQLRLSGVLDTVSGIIVGQFTNKEPGDAQQIDQIIGEYADRVHCPVISNFPVGHVSDNATLPNGVRVELDADRGSVVLLEEPCGR